MSDVAAKVAKAADFLLMAEIADELGSYDAAVSLAVSAAINASDALILAAGGVVPSGDDHAVAERSLSRLAGPDAAKQLSRALRLKSQAQYQIRRCTAAEAAKVLQAAERLVNKSKGI
jgi:uncharacterized protein (UPF0332 family)